MRRWNYRIDAIDRWVVERRVNLALRRWLEEVKRG